MISDEELCRQLQAGDEAAMEALVHRYHRPVFGYLFRLLEQRSAAEDLTQETFARLLVRAGQYRYPQPFRPWVYAIAHNLYRDYCKALENRASVPVAEPVPQWSPAPFDLSLRIAERMEVVNAIRTLDPAHRAVILLRYYHDLKVEEIAAVTGVPPGTVKSRLFSAMQKLRLLLADESAAEGRNSGAKTVRANRP